MSPYIGTSPDAFLDDEDLLAESEAVAIKRVIAFQLQQKMADQQQQDRVSAPDGDKSIRA